MTVVVYPGNAPALHGAMRSIGSHYGQSANGFATGYSEVTFTVPELPSTFSGSVKFALYNVTLRPASPTFVFYLGCSVRVCYRGSQFVSVVVMLVHFVTSGVTSGLSWFSV